MNSGNVLGFLAAPDRDSSLRAISLAILRIRTFHGLTYKELSKMLGCSADTVENATNEKSMLSFDAVARLGYFFPAEFGAVVELWAKGAEPLTADDHRKAIEHHATALARMVREDAA